MCTKHDFRFVKKFSLITIRLLWSIGDEEWFVVDAGDGCWVNGFTGTTPGTSNCSWTKITSVESSDSSCAFELGCLRLQNSSVFS